MKKLTTLSNIFGVLLIIIGVLMFAFCSMISDPEIEGESGRTPLSAYCISLVPIVMGILLLIFSYKSGKNKTSN
jgi:drug/metabolite transporter (DMT)-like permease